MLRALAGAGVPAPAVEGEHDGVLLLEHVANDGVFSPNAWADIGAGAGAAARAHRRGLWLAGRLCARHGRARQSRERRLAALLGRAEAGRRGAACSTGPGASGSSGWPRGSATCCPPRRPPALLHGDLWTGNILVSDGRLAGLIDPACYHGHAEVDLAML